MGASYDSTTFKACDVNTLKAHFVNIQNNRCYDSGSDAYAGHIGIASGISVHEKVFKNNQSAEEYVMEVAQKWGPAIAVKVGDFSQIFPMKANEKKEVEKLSELQDKHTNWSKNLVERVKKSKSAFRGCKVCQSKIAVRYLRGTDCPVCSDMSFIETSTDKANYKVLTDRLQEQKKKVKEMERKYLEKNKENYWYIGAWCAS